MVIEYFIIALSFAITTLFTIHIPVVTSCLGKQSIPYWIGSISGFLILMTIFFPIKVLMLLDLEDYINNYRIEYKKLRDEE